MALAPGTACECRYRDTPQFFPGTVDAVDGGGLYAIAYDDGDREEGVARRRIKLPGHKQRGELEVGEGVDARHDGGDVLPGVVAARAGAAYAGEARGRRSP